MPEKDGFYELKKHAAGNSDGSDGSENAAAAEPVVLSKRPDSDPMTLHGEVNRELRREFKSRGTSYLSSQLDALSATAEALLTADPGTVTVSAQTPGAGKSTLIRALISILAPRFAALNDPVAQEVGGITIVVETSLEGHELLELANAQAGCAVATLVESANDSVLRRGGCPSGLAGSYKQCKRRACQNYKLCPLMRSQRWIHQTPILIILQARYLQHIDSMADLMFWYNDAGEECRRRWLLVDELPCLFEDNSISISSLNIAENEIDTSLASFDYTQNNLKRNLLYRWGRDVRSPLRKLLGHVQKGKGHFGLVPAADITAAGVNWEQLKELDDLLIKYNVGFEAQKLTAALLSSGSSYFNISQEVSVSFPRLVPFDDSEEFMTFIFSGTAELAPEITENPDIQLLADTMEESYARLTVHIQRGNGFSASKTALRSATNLHAAVAWVKHIIAQERGRHNKFLLITYKEDAADLWRLLSEHHDDLIPYIDRAGESYDRLPYFGGLSGSNRYLEATCVICVGLNRYDPGEYLNRALALDTSGEVAAAIAAAKDSGDTRRLTQMPPVMEIQDITLAQDIVQLVFRSALRMHGETKPISLWLFQPPKGTVEHIRRYFGDCRVDEVADLPVECATAKTRSAQRMGEPTHAAKMLQWLFAEWTTLTITPDEIRKATGLTQEQFKEAKKNPDVKRFFAENVITHGSGKNAIYERKGSHDAA